MRSRPEITLFSLRLRLEPALLWAFLLWSPALSGCDHDSDPNAESGEEIAGVQSGTEAIEDAGMEADDLSLSGEMSPGGQETAGDEARTHTCGPDGPTRIHAVVELSFAEPSAGVSPGFDLDGVQSESGDPQGCGKSDYQTEDGQPGVDNQFAELLPLIDPLVNRPINEALAETISEGRLILLIELEGLDDLEEDDCVNVNLFRAEEGALFGGDGLLLAGQSYSLDLAQPWARAEGGEVRDGQVITKPFDFALPLNFFGEEVEVSLTSSRLSLSLDESNPTGVLAGALMIDPFVEEVAMIAADFVLIARNLLSAKADLLPNEFGSCQAISAVWSMRTRSGHLYLETPRPQTPPTDFSDL